MKRWLPVALIVTLLLLCACQTGHVAPRYGLAMQTAQTEGESAVTDIDEPRGPSDAVEVEAFFDGVMLTNLASRHVAGAVVTVVREGEMLFSKGYGYANVSEGTPPDPATTMFRVGSVSKLFTWTAVMQLVERGLIDLDKDIASYLDFDLETRFAEPITMRHLLSHTAGYEDRSFALNAESPETMMAHGDWLKTHIPAQVRAPGDDVSYSNYGTSLAGYVVECVSGMSYDAYVEQNILEPLGMDHSTTLQPLPGELAPHMSEGYRWSGAGFVAQPFELYCIGPAGGHSATANDMAKFMIAHLLDGRYGDARILQEATAQQMQSQLYTPDERIGCMAHGFMEKDRNGLRVLAHGGDTVLFHSDLKLLIDEKVGVFVSCNTESGMGFPAIVTSAFIDHYYPVAGTQPTRTSDWAARAEKVAGTYRPIRMSYTTGEKALALVATYALTFNDDGELLMSGTRFVEVEPYVYQKVGTDRKLIVHLDEDGRVDSFYLHGSPWAFERVRGLQSPTPNFALLAIGTLLFLSVLVGWPLLVWARKGCERPAQTQLARAARWVLVIVSALSLLFLLVFGATALDDGTPLYDGFMLIKVWTALFWGMVVAAIAALAMAIVIWRNATWRVAARVHYTLVTLFGWGFIWFACYWHLLKL